MRLNEIAKACDVSIATVSKVINQKKGVGAETRHRILKFISDSNITLSSKPTKLIALILPTLLNPFFTLILEEILREIDDKNIDILIFEVDNNIESEMKTIENLDNKNIDGFILVSSSVNSNKLAIKKLLLDTTIPFILVDQKIDSTNFDAVYLDNVKGAFNLTKYLINNGKRDITIISGDIDYISSVERVEGYKEALYFNNIEVDDNKIIYTDFKDSKKIQKALSSLITKDNYPPAIICCNSLILQQVLKFMFTFDLKLNKDIVVVSFDNTYFLDNIGLNITCVSPDIKQLAKESINLLMQNINSKKTTTSQINVVPELIIKSNIM